MLFMQAPIGPQAYLCMQVQVTTLSKTKPLPTPQLHVIQGFMDLNLGEQSIDATCITTNAKPINLGNSNL
jgi:hypothetical protein